MAATLFRFYNFLEIPFTHDEFSALFRTGFTDFNRLLTEGVLVDFHPAGVQVFLNYYGQFFGYDEWVWKLPFLIMGTASVYLMYLIGKEWFNTRTGLLLAAFGCCTQYFVLYSQLARPYGIGLFLGLLAILYWQRFLFQGDKANFKHYLLWIFFAAACAYIHYYLLLSLIILALLGLPMVSKSRCPLYMFSALGIFILYLPHLPIFLDQLSKGGVESWLGKPDRRFIWDFIQYLFEFLPYFLLSLTVLFLFGLFSSKFKVPRLWWLAAFLFAFSFSVGYLYSKYINAILQFSGLIFSAPFLLMAFLYPASLKKWSFYLAMVLIFGFGTYGLIFHREHYSILYQSPYEYLVKDIKEVQSNRTQPSLVILDNRKDILKYYTDRYKLETDQLIITDNKWAAEDFDTLFSNSKSKDILLGAFASSNNELLSIAQHYYPYIKKRKSYYHGEFYQLSKNDGDTISIDLWTNHLNFSKQDLWQYNKASVKTDTTGLNYLEIKPQASGLSLEVPTFNHIPYSLTGFLDVELETEVTKEAYIAIAAYNLNGEIYRWYAHPFSKYGDKEHGTTIFASFSLQSLKPNPSAYKLKIFIGNPAQESFRVYKAGVTTRKGNPKLYSLYTPILRE